VSATRATHSRLNWSTTASTRKRRPQISHRTRSPKPSTGSALAVRSEAPV
jgi:hypothetical protein